MSRRSRADLCGCIRLVNVPDGIGIPVFSVANSNSRWVAETDGDFRITRFLKIPEEVGYPIIYEVPPGLPRARMVLGEHLPLPFWIDGKLHQVKGDAYPSDIPDISAIGDGLDVLQDVRRLLDDARNGRFKERLQRDEAERIFEAFPDVFEETPVHSKYWVSRFRLAATEPNPEGRPPQVAQRLQTLGRSWLERFGSKTDLPRFRALISNGYDGVFSPEEVRNLYFAFIVDKLAQRDFANVVRAFMNDATFRELFPGGIYRHHQDGKWPNTPFDYRKPRFLLDPLLSAVRDHHEQAEALNALRGLAYIYFGQADAPPEFSDRLSPFRQAAQRQLNAAYERMRDIKRMGWATYGDNNMEQVHLLVDAFDRMAYLEAIDIGNYRLAKKLEVSFLSISWDYVDSWRKNQYYRLWKQDRYEFDE